MLTVDIEKRLDRFTLKAKFSCSGEPLALFGASGAGKSMTLKCIAGIEKPDKGYIKLNDRVLYDSEHHINLPPQKRHVGYLFQDYALFPDMTVSQNIETGLTRYPRKDRAQQVREITQRFHLTGLESKRPATLSGGEKQRVALARIFASAPDVLLLDEPFSSLDTYLKLELLPYVKKLITAFKGECILVTHNIDEVLYLCDKAAPIENGITKQPLKADVFYTEIKQHYQEAGIILPEIHV